MRAQHDDFVCPVRSGNFGDDIEGIERVIHEPILHVELDRHAHVVLEQPRDPVVVFARDDNLCGRQRFFRITIRIGPCTRMAPWSLRPVPGSSTAIAPSCA